MKARILMSGGIAAAITAIIALFNMLSDSPYWPATAGEIIELAGEVRGNTAGILLMQQNQNLQQIYDNRDRQEQVKRQGGNLTNLRQMERHLEKEQKRLARELQKLEGN